MQWYIFRELVKRLDPDLPFYLWTARDPYDHPLVPFDGREDDHGDHGYGVRHERLHRLQRNAREDPAIFVAGRALIPPRHGAALRQRLYRPPAQLPDVHPPPQWFLRLAHFISLGDRNRDLPNIWSFKTAWILVVCALCNLFSHCLYVQCNPFIMIALGYEQSIHNNHTIDTASIY